jgi:hypothetical protein
MTEIGITKIKTQDDNEYSPVTTFWFTNQDNYNF